MNILVLFDGSGLARLGLERAGHYCVGVELDPTKHELSRHVGSGNCVLGDARHWPELRHHGRLLSGLSFQGVWMSPPCAMRSSAIKDLTGKNGYRNPEYQGDHLWWCLREAKRFKVSWIENVTVQGSRGNEWGKTWNAAQFERDPRQCRNRVIGGHHLPPVPVYREYRRLYQGLDICPCVSATEWKGCATDKLRASRWYGRKLSLAECALRQGFPIPAAWRHVPSWFMPEYRHRAIHWVRNQYEAIGNGVPIFMAEAFGNAHHGKTA